MAAVDIPVVDFVYAFLVLVPGFLSYEMARRTGKIPASFDSFDKLAFSLMGSGISLFLFATSCFIVLWFLAIVLIWYGVDLLILHEIISTQFPDQGMEVYVGALFIIGYPWLILLAGLVGYAVGKISISRARNRGHYRTNDSVWDQIFKTAGSEQIRTGGGGEHEVETDGGEPPYRNERDDDSPNRDKKFVLKAYVMTETGKEIYGRVEGYGEPSADGSGELFLRSPHIVVERGRNGRVIKSYKMKDSVYINSDNIREIFFESKLPRIHR